MALYHWSDIELRHDFYQVEYLPESDRIRFSIHPDARKEILSRLLKLNKKIHSTEDLKHKLPNSKGIMNVNDLPTLF